MGEFKFYRPLVKGCLGQKFFSHFRFFSKVTVDSTCKSLLTLKKSCMTPPELQKITLYHRLTKVKASKSTKSAKERHYQVLAEILKFYKNPNPKWRMITDDKDQRDKLKSFAPKMKFGAKDLKKLKSVKDGRPSICERCKKCPTMCEL